MTWEKKKVYVVTILLADKDEEGEELNWTHYTEEYFADTIDEAEKMKEKFLKGKDRFYGNLVEDCFISDEMEEREFSVSNKMTCSRRKVGL